MRLFLLLLMAIIAGRIAVMCSFDLFPDEALYAWLASTDPLAFCPHPPGVPLGIKAFMLLLGKNEFAVRLLSLVCSVAVLVPLWFLAKGTTGSRRSAVWVLTAFLAVPIFFAIGAVATPDMPQLFFWTTALYFTWLALSSGRKAAWSAAGLTIALGLYFKYILILYYPALLLCIIMVQEWRPLLRQPGFYLRLLSPLALFLPCAIFSDYLSGWPTLRYHLSDRQEFMSPSVKGLVEYVGGHFLYYSPILYAGTIAGTVFVWRKWKKTGDRASAFLFAFAVVPCLFFLLITTVTKRELSREQWDAPAMIAGLIAVVILWDHLAAAGPASTRRRWILTGHVGIGLALLLCMATVLEATTGLASAALGKKPFFSSFMGWKQTVGDADKDLNTLSSDAPFVLANSWTFAIMYDFYGRRQLNLYTLDHPTNAQFGLVSLLRKHKMLQGFMSREVGRDAVFLMQGDSPAHNSTTRVAQRMQKLSDIFTRADLTEPITIGRGSKPVQRFQNILCYKLRKIPGQK